MNNGIFGKQGLGFTASASFNLGGGGASASAQASPVPAAPSPSSTPDYDVLPGMPTIAPPPVTMPIPWLPKTVVASLLPWKAPTLSTTSNVSKMTPIAPKIQPLPSSFVDAKRAPTLSLGPKAPVDQAPVEESFLQKNGVALAIGGVVLAAGVVYLLKRKA